MSANRLSSALRPLGNWLWGFLLVGIFLLAQSWNAAWVLTPTGINFVDADCYSRMTRVKMIEVNPTQIRIAAHDFENYPEGTHPHTTAPMDYLIATLALVTDRDRAGAYVSPLLGLLTLVGLWIAAIRLRLPYRHALTLLFAVSPILAHGFALGRPDHQSLVLALITFGLLAEIARGRSRIWDYVWGISWGLALWTSLFEPVILLAAVLLTRAVGWTRPSTQTVTGSAKVQWITLGVLVALSQIIDGIRIPQIDSANAAVLRQWATTIGELHGASLSLLVTWVGWSLPLVFIGLGIARWRGNRFALRILILLAIVTALTLIHSRWGYFFALIFCFSLPFAFGWIRQRWLVYPIFIISLWPVAAEWDAKFFPDAAAQAQRAETRSDLAALREVGNHLVQIKPDGGVLAPWWLSPALAYESGWPQVAGSSHESISGIADSARFFLCADPLTAREILEKRRVRFVVTYDADRLDINSSQILGRQPAGPTTAQHLAQRQQTFLPELQMVFASGPFRVYERSFSPPAEQK